MSYPLDCRACGGYEYHKADCPLERERDRAADQRHREQMARIARESAPASQRERIATAALQGLLAQPHRVQSEDINALAAVAYADALIAELDKPVKP